MRGRNAAGAPAKVPALAEKTACTRRAACRQVDSNFRIRAVRTPAITSAQS
jgi:hypothetical protein